MSGLMKMVTILGLDNKRPLKLVREEVTQLTKLINLQQKSSEAGLKHPTELNFEGFMEFVLQMSHLAFNLQIYTGYGKATQYELRSFQLQERFN